MTDTLDHIVETRRGRILDGALKVFLAYGFQRTTMEDIARSVDISRPALYLEFRNKSDIYRALAEEFLDRALGMLSAELSGSGTLNERLERALRSVMDMMCEIEETPHGAELVDMKNKLAGDLMVEGRMRVAAVVKAAIAEAGDRAEGGTFEPDILGDLLLDAIDGMKLRQLPLEEQRRLCRHYVAAISALACGPTA